MATSIWKSESQFQAACVKWFDREYPEQRGRLMGIYNNPPNAIVGAMLISMGVRPGRADLLYFPPTINSLAMPQYRSIRVAWIELKILGRSQSDDQILFEQMVLSWKHEYHVITEHLNEFQSLIKSYQ